MHLPWNGEVVARGMEFGSTPFAEGLRKSGTGLRVWRARVPVDWNPAETETEFTIFLEEIPEGFVGVRDVKREGGRLGVVPNRPETQNTSCSTFCWTTRTWIIPQP